MEEYQVLSLFQEIYSEVFEYKIYELFEIYEYRPNLKIGAKEIYLIIIFSAALDSHQVLEFIFLFGNLLYSILSGGNEVKLNNIQYIYGTIYFLHTITVIFEFINLIEKKFC